MLVLCTYELVFLDGECTHLCVCACVCVCLCVCRKLLISDINDLRARQLEEKTASSTQGDEKEDPVVLKLKLA